MFILVAFKCSFIALQFGFESSIVNLTSLKEKVTILSTDFTACRVLQIALFASWSREASVQS